MMLLSKEATGKDRSLKNSDDCNNYKSKWKRYTEAIWQKNGYFGDEKSFNISKNNSLRIHLSMRIDLCIIIGVIFWLLKVAK